MASTTYKFYFILVMFNISVIFFNSSEANAIKRLWKKVKTTHQQSQNPPVFYSNLVGQKEELANLKLLYGSLPNFKKKIDSLSEEFSHMRRVAGDGNCFYRSFAFGYFEYLLNQHRARTIFKNLIHGIKDELIFIGFNELEVTNMHNKFIEMIKIIEDGNGEKLYEMFNDITYSNNVVAYLRLITSAEIRKHPLDYQNFIENRTLLEFCHKDVEPMGAYADHVQITALCRALNVNVNIAYLYFKSTSIEPIVHTFPNEDDPSCIHFLFRPEHYDILYSNRNETCNIVETMTITQVAPSLTEVGEAKSKIKTRHPSKSQISISPSVIN